MVVKRLSRGDTSAQRTRKSGQAIKALPAQSQMGYAASEANSSAAPTPLRLLQTTPSSNCAMSPWIA